ncbi:hypothetical protein [Bradyrhizobium liaoningense]|uniref:hypothetical protein n=1 Tax=Bradyrhizobium liaoningense TaxID=43992 RepID=UPI001BA5F708|nr:hypothetical protein [Bradyrhizobium liaoningense]MBR0822348.1 hypothetical protein [Bradyrhizobium liaoningense]
MTSSRRVWFTRAGSTRRGFFRLDFEIGRCPHPATHSLDHVKGAPIGALPSEPLLAVHARTCRPAALGPLLAPLRSPDTEIGFAPETIALRHAICRVFSFRGEMMTAYLISLALAGLVAIVLWKTFS